MDQPGTEATIRGILAQLNAQLHILSLALGAVLMSWHYRQDEQWRSQAGLALTLSLAMLVLFIITAVTLAMNVGIAGLIQRIFIITSLAWFTLTAVHLRNLSF